VRGGRFAAGRLALFFAGALDFAFTGFFAMFDCSYAERQYTALDM